MLLNQKTQMKIWNNVSSNFSWLSYNGKIIKIPLYGNYKVKYKCC